MDFLPKIKIELMVPDNRLEGALAAISRGAGLTRNSDDRIFVSNIEDALRLQPEAMAALAN